MGELTATKTPDKMSKSCSEEFSPKNFSLEYLTPESFVNSQWRVPQAIYFIWRVVAATFFIVWIIMSGAVDNGSATNRVEWFIYLTNWAFFLLTINTIIEMVTVGMALLKRKDGSTYHDMPWFYKMSWVMYNVATTTGLLVTVGYWGLLYSSSYGVHYISIGTHALNSVYILVNLFITGIPVRIQHFWHCLVLSVVYIIFSVIYDVSTGIYIYSVLDWDYPGTAVFYAIMFGIVAPIVLWLIVYGLYWVRIAIFRGCECTNNYHTSDNKVKPEDVAANSEKYQA